MEGGSCKTGDLGALNGISMKCFGQLLCPAVCKEKLGAHELKSVLEISKLSSDWSEFKEAVHEAYGAFLDQMGALIKQSWENELLSSVFEAFQEMLVEECKHTQGFRQYLRLCHASEGFKEKVSSWEQGIADPALLSKLHAAEKLIAGFLAACIAAEQQEGTRAAEDLADTLQTAVALRDRFKAVVVAALESQMTRHTEILTPISGGLAQSSWKARLDSSNAKMAAVLAAGQDLVKSSVADALKESFGKAWKETMLKLSQRATPHLIDLPPPDWGFAYETCPLL